MPLGFLKKQLAKTHNLIASALGSAMGAKSIGESIESIEEALVMADMGVTTSSEIAELLRGEFISGEKAVRDKLEEILTSFLKPVEEPLVIDSSLKPFVIMVLGVNGVGKTTTIGKLASKFSSEGKSVVLGAADTFRAAAADQLSIWAERTGADIIRGSEGGDPGSVAFDTVKAAIARKADVAIIDTAGRLHSDSNLIEELKKVDRVIGRAFELEDKTLLEAPHERLLVLDGTTGQNALTQAKTFSSAVKITGIAVTKLDGTAKGGIIVPIARELSTPVRFIGVGEKVEDLQVFSSNDYVKSLI